MTGPEQHRLRGTVDPFNVDDLDPRDPFQIDERNAPHLAKHEGCDPELLYSMWVSECRFFPAAHGPADWFMVADVGGEFFVAALMRSAVASDGKCRPVGLRRAPLWLVDAYLDAL